MSERSFGGADYVTLVVDGYNRFTWAYMIKTKDATFEGFQDRRTLVEKEFGYQVEIPWADQGGEITSNAMAEYHVHHGIKHEFSNTGAPSESGART